MNSAQRIHKIYTDFRDIVPPSSQQNVPPSAVDAWANLFDRHESSGQNLDQIGEECAYAVQQEVQNLGSLLKDKGVPVELYERHINILRIIASARHLHDHWATVSKIVRPEQIAVLEWAAYVLGLNNQDSSEIDAEIDRLAAEITKLIDDVENGGLPPVLRSFLLRSFRSIKEGMWRYKVTGLDPLRASVQTVRGTSDFQINELRQAVDDLPQDKKNLWNRAENIINSVAEACDKATKIDGGYTLLSGVGKVLFLGLSGG